MGAEQAVVQRVGVEVGALLGFDTRDEPYFERVDEQVNRLVASVDAAANGAGMLLDLQLNERAYLISLLATIFAPLTFLTGFFGMNFGWMTDQIDTQTAFWLVGIVVPIALALLCWRLLARRFLIGAIGGRAAAERSAASRVSIRPSHPGEPGAMNIKILRSRSRRQRAIGALVSHRRPSGRHRHVEVGNVSRGRLLGVDRCQVVAECARAHRAGRCQECVPARPHAGRSGAPGIDGGWRRRRPVDVSVGSADEIHRVLSFARVWTRFEWPGSPPIG